MQIAKNKTAAIAIAIFLIASMTASSMLLPSASAHSPPRDLPTYAYVFPAPNPVGVGQTTIIYMWLNRQYGYTPEDPGFGPSAIIAYAAVNNDYRFHNYNLTIIYPNGDVNTTIFKDVNDTTSNVAYAFTPTVTGNYTILFNFPGQAYNSSSGNYNPASVLVNDYYLPCSANATLLVVDTDLYTFPDSYPLPTEYWTRPIYGENPIWWTISSNWLGSGMPGFQGISASFNLGGNGQIWYPGDAVGPLTNHIMWTKPLESGGIVGGNEYTIPGNAYFEGSAYNQRFQNPIIVDGLLFYTAPVSFTGYASGPLTCVDLRTGQEKWSRMDLPTLSFALAWDHEDPNQHGVFPPILSTSNFGRLFDAWTGVPLFNVTGVPSAGSNQLALGPNGEQLRYLFTNLGSSSTPNWVLARWNSTKLWNYAYNPYSVVGGTPASLLSPSIINATYNGNPNVQALVTVVPIPITGTTGTTSTGSTAIFPYGSTLQVNGGTGFDAASQTLNMTDPQNRFDYAYAVPTALSNYLQAGNFTVVGLISDDIMLCEQGALPSEGARFMGNYELYNPYTYIGVNLNASNGNIGDVLWTQIVQPPEGNLTVLLAGIDPVNRVFCENLRETSNYIGYSLDDGSYLWGPTPPQAALDYYGSQASGSLTNCFAYGKLYSSAYAGIVYCYDTNTGDIVFTYGNGGLGNDTSSGLQVPGPYPTFINAIGNDVVYLITSEHTVETPIPKGCQARAINATTGAEIWTLSTYITEFFASSYAIADGYATWFNSYDDSIYSVGRGASVTTVNAPSASITVGGSVVISGTVMDVSAGSQQPEQIARFPNGLPVSSDASMREWMGYVYQQKPLAENFTGVDVTIIALDSNGNYQDVGTATTDAKGTYWIQWTPPIAGNYTLTASFAGTNGYWPSKATTAFGVDGAAAVQTPPPTTQPTTVVDQYFFPAIAALIIVIIVMGIAVILALRKKP